MIVPSLSYRALTADVPGYIIIGTLLCDSVITSYETIFGLCGMRREAVSSISICTKLAVPYLWSMVCGRWTKDGWHIYRKWPPVDGYCTNPDSHLTTFCRTGYDRHTTHCSSIRTLQGLRVAAHHRINDKLNLLRSCFGVQRRQVAFWSRRRSRLCCDGRLYR